MRSAFGQTRSAIGQIRAHLTNFVRILSLLVGLTKCAAHLGKRAARLAKRARDLPNVAQLVKFRAFDQLVKCPARLPKCADWSNAPYNMTGIPSDSINGHKFVMIIIVQQLTNKYHQSVPMYKQPRTNCEFPYKTTITAPFPLPCLSVLCRIGSYS